MPHCRSARAARMRKQWAQPRRQTQEPAPRGTGAVGFEIPANKTQAAILTTTVDSVKLRCCAAPETPETLPETPVAEPIRQPVQSGTDAAAAVASGDAAVQVRAGGSVQAFGNIVTAEEIVFEDIDIGPELEDALYAQGVSNEFVILCAQAEDKVLAITGAVDDDPGASQFLESPLFIIIRSACLGFMSDVAQAVGLEQKTWFEAVTLFDAYCRRKPPRDQFTHIPSLCVAVLKLLQKKGSSRISFKGANFCAYTSQLAATLRDLGVEASEGSTETIATLEQELLMSLRWRVNLPSIGSWLSLFYARFNVLTRGVFSQTLSLIWQQSLVYAHYLLFRQPLCEAAPTRRLARGLVSIMLASVRLVAVEALRPPSLSVSEWEQLFVDCHPPSAVPDLASRTARSEQPAQVLEIVMGINRATLQQDSEYVAKLSRDMLHQLALQTNSSSGNALGCSPPLQSPQAVGHAFRTPVIAGVVQQDVAAAIPAQLVAANPELSYAGLQVQSRPPPQVHYACC